MLNIRSEKPEDNPKVKQINDLAFGQVNEGEIVDRLRESGIRYLSLVAEKDGNTVGYIFFSPTEIEGYPEIKGGMGLAPMAVLPEFQNQGIGSLLVREGIKQLKNSGTPFIIVLGHEKFYPRFGFEPASKYRLKCQWDGVPDEVFMVLIFDKKAMENVSGIAKYCNEFNDAM